MTEQAFLIWGFGLLGASVLIFLLELIIPSAGILGFVALAAAIAGVVAFFNVSVTWGMLASGFVLVMVPVALLFAFKVMPHTPIGRALFLREDESARQRENTEGREVDGRRWRRGVRRW